MAEKTALNIARLCDAWHASAVGPDGSLSIGGSSEDFRLLTNGVNFSTLDYDELIAALLGLTKVLIHPRLNVVVDRDHFEFWAWCGELFISSRALNFALDQFEIRSLYTLVLHASLADCRYASSATELTEKNRVFNLQTRHAKGFLQGAILSLSYLAFPLLEALLKRACAAFVAFDGRVIKPFSVEKKLDGMKHYKPGERPSHCSSLRDLLFLHYSEIASPELKKSIDCLCSYYKVLDEKQHPFDLIYHWRNSSLHGYTNFHTIGSALLNYSLLISLDEIKPAFEAHRTKALMKIEWNMESGHNNPFSFYPPY